MTTTIRALTLLEPWASLVALGRKTVETRKQPVGLLVGEEFLIHAGQRRLDESLTDEVLRWAGLDPGMFVPQYGNVIAFATVEAIEESDGGMAFGWLSRLHGEERDAARDREYRLGDYRPGRTLYILRDVQRLVTPIRARGMQGVWTPDREVLSALIGASRRRAHA